MYGKQLTILLLSTRFCCYQFSSAIQQKAMLQKPKFESMKQYEGYKCTRYNYYDIDTVLPGTASFVLMNKNGRDTMYK